MFSRIVVPGFLSSDVFRLFHPCFPDLFLELFRVSWVSFPDLFRDSFLIFLDVFSGLLFP